MRGLANALKIQAPSLYWHFPNKQALLDAHGGCHFWCSVATARCEGARPGTSGLKAVVRAIRQALLAHRDGAHVFAGTYVLTDNVLRVVEAMMALMREAGASPKLQPTPPSALSITCWGFTTEEQGLDPRTGGPLDLSSRQAEFASLAAKKYPNIHSALKHMFSNDFDDRFEEGLDLLIRGLKARIDSRS